MFKRRRKHANNAALAGFAPPQSQEHRRLGSASTIATTSHATASATPADPFDFHLIAPPFAQDGLRPQTSDGTPQRSNSVSVDPPMLPPIKRVSSQYESTSFMDMVDGDRRDIDTNYAEDDKIVVEQEPADANNTASGSTPPKSPRPPPSGKDYRRESKLYFPPAPRSLPVRPSTANASTPPRMESTLFPTKPPSPTPLLPQINTDLPMTRAWIDARDKPYAPPSSLRPQIHSTSSSPDLRTAAVQTSAAITGSSPLSTVSGPASTRPLPQSSFSTGNIYNLIRPPSNVPTNYSGTTARSNRSSKSTTAASDLPTPTIGTPYAETSPAFPLPQHVMTRPKTAGSLATLKGVDVPTHHTSALLSRVEAPAKPEKRKTKLLNPMHLLSRRRSGQDDETLTVQAQALRRQKNVAAVGVNKIPEDFDPRIRGKVVHDFSVPRQSRQYSYSNALDPWGQKQGHDRELPTSHGAPFISTSYDKASKQRLEFESSPRRSIHTAMFKEHLSDDTAQSNASAAAVQAERLENKAFLNRASLISQDSAVLPPFARRSQQIESMQTNHSNDESVLPIDKFLAASKERERERDSHLSSSSSGISPVTQWNSALPGAIDSMQEGVSPISLTGSDKHGLSFISRPMSEISGLGSSDGPKSYRMSEVSKLGSTDGTRPISTVSSGSGAREEFTSDGNVKYISSQPVIEPIAEEQTPKIGDGIIPLPERAAPSPPSPPSDDQPLSRGLNIPPRTTSAGASMTSSSLGAPSPLSSPEAETENPFANSNGPPNIVKKRSDAAGHAKRASSTAKPKHRISNASRFSFQFGGSAAEELALEEKARKLGVSSAASGAVGIHGRDDDEEDYFDEDAMDDMDEMEFQAQQTDSGQDLHTPAPFNYRATSVSPVDSSFMPLALARQQLQVDEDDLSDGVTEPDSDEEEPYWDHDDFRSYTHTRDHSTADRNSTAGHRRISSAGVQGLTLNTNVGSNAGGFYMHPQAAGYSPIADRASLAQKPQLPHRDSGNSERNRIASGMSFGPSVDEDTEPTHRAKTSKSTIDSVDGVTDRSFQMSSAAGSGSTEATGLGLSGFSGFKFTDTPDPSRPNSLEAKRRFHSADRTRGDSETLPTDATLAASTTGIATSPADEYLPHVQHPYTENRYDLEDMYFDDGGFEGDVNDRAYVGTSMNEDAFDDDAFLDTTNRMGRYEHSIAKPNGDLGFRPASFVARGDGPYPDFARPNSAKMRERDSQLLLEDLPLMAPVDPKLIPQRNPSEDAKRLGRNSMVPPPPVQQGVSAAEIVILQNRLHAYHATLAAAAQKAYEEGRFSEGRMLDVPGSSAVTRSESLYSKAEGGEEQSSRLPRSVDDRMSQYSRAEDDDHYTIPSVDRNRFASVVREDSVLQPQVADRYSLPRMSFDFDFASIAMDDSITDDALRNDGADDGYDDFVAEANAEVLASDDDGFYGQEFGFYAKARPHSGEVQAVNGGYFGLDGDDGLNRQRSVKEPNLTPITELSEFSTRTSYIGTGMGGSFGPSSSVGGAFSPFAPGGAFLPVAPWVENEVNHLRRLKANAFGGSNASFHSDASSGAGSSAPGSARAPSSSAGVAQGYTGLLGSHPMTIGHSNNSSTSSNPPSSNAAHYGHALHESPHSATSNPHSPFSASAGGETSDITPKKPVLHAADIAAVPITARKLRGSSHAHSHSRTSSGADSVTYVREQDPDGQGPPRWVLERRRTSEAGLLELVGREVVQDGWI